MDQKAAALSTSKWIEGISPDQPLHMAAHRILEVRLKPIEHWLPLAAKRSDEQIEYVHQLRVSSRRAMAAVCVFSNMIPKKVGRALRGELRQLRLAADGARNLDVLGSQLARSIETSDGGYRAKFLEEIRQRRREAQPAIVAVYREFCERKLGEMIDRLLDAVRDHRRGKGKRPFGRQAPRYLKRPLDKFFKAAEADLSADQSLHRLRIRGKKLRYTMEILAVNFAPEFRKNLYPQFVRFQDVMGAVNDHRTAIALFGDWLAKPRGVQRQAFLQGLLFAEERAHRDAKRAALVIWTPDTVARLRRQFKKHGGSSES